jgi:hypothetical protein|tara:strand:+ start:1066 stop:1299 length:234 start_codon:yes stop_codon:yes gene_type:complete
MDKSLRTVLNIVDEHRDNIPEGAYIDICNNLRDIRNIHTEQTVKLRLTGVGKFIKFLIYTGISSGAFNALKNKLIKK